MLTILDAIRDRKLLGASPAFADLVPWRAWLAFLAVLYGLEVEPRDRPLVRAAMGRIGFAREGGFAEAEVVVGRQAGKTRAAAAVVAFEAAFAPRCRDGELYALLLAQDQRAAIRSAFSYIAAFFDTSPLLRRLVVNRTADTLELENGMRVAAYPCRPAAVRGLRARVVVLDELAFFRSSDMLPLDVETLRAVRPTLATTGGRLVVLSSPYGQTGALWETHRRHFGREGSPVLVWQASAPAMNPLLPADYLERMRETDPEAYRGEVLGEFRAGLAALFDLDALEACVVPDRRELPPVEGLSYAAFVDPSGGRGDAFTLGVGHRAGDRVVPDLVRAWRPPFNPSGVVAEIVALLRTYRVGRVVGDRYAGEWPREAFRAHEIEYALAEKPKSELYLELLSAINSRRVELPDDPALLRELRALERQRGSAGRDRVDHPRGQHDDRANAVAGLVHRLLREDDAVRDLDLSGGQALSAWAMPSVVPWRGARGLDRGWDVES